MSRCISVITPVHPDASDYLTEAYQSLLAQQLPTGWEWRWIVQQDGCTHEVTDLLPAD
jgi:glycosyltransferase involved in cell wall biosynthesis